MILMRIFVFVTNGLGQSCRARFIFVLNYTFYVMSPTPSKVMTVSVVFSASSSAISWTWKISEKSVSFFFCRIPTLP